MTRNSARDTGAARLPALPSVRTGDQALDRWIQAVSERLEVREGARGNPYERAVTLRELEDMGLALTPKRTSQGGAAGTGGVLVRQPDGSYTTMTPGAFADSLRESRLFQSLTRKLDDVARFDEVPAKVREIILLELAEEARRRGAEIRRLEEKLQSDTQSLAYTVQEVTAAVDSAAAGVRDTTFAMAEANRAVAGKVEQVVARLDGVGGVTIEESVLAVADRVAGLAGEYMVKVTAGGAVAGFGLAASEDPSGATESAFIVQADKFAVVSPGTTPQVPFGVDARGVYINGSLRINSGGVPIGSLTSGIGIDLTYDTQFFKYNSSGAPINSTITLTATLKGGLTGYVKWEALSGYSGALPAEGTSNTATISQASMTAESATFKVSKQSDGVTYVTTVTIAKLRDGARGPAGATGATGSPGATGTRGTIVTKISGEWNSYTAASAISTIASAAGASPTYPITGDIVHYTGGAMECVSAGYPGTWRGVAAYIDGSMVVTGSLDTSKLSTGDLTAFNIRTAYSGSRWEITGGTYAMQLRGFFGSEPSPRAILDSADGTLNFQGRSSTSTSRFTSPASAHTLMLANTGSGAPLRLEPRATLPSDRTAGNLCFYNGNLCVANGSHWYTFTGMSQLT